ncbi:MAG: ABC transporter ATP-binding protein [Gammaproteobacteria bacterium]|nr:ABC transporter ATP-binding protein [Gammaproteobacteria bacterium]
MPPLLEVKALIKHYRGVTAVDGVSFAIEPGLCFGLLGPNGAGKTTTVEMLEGVTAPTGGETLYKSQPLGPRFRDEAGIMFQSTALQDFITVRETLEMFARLYCKSAPVASVIEQCSLREFLDRDTRKLSGGQRQRLLLAIALVNDPEIIFLDEPTTGLDPQARRNFWALVEGIKARGKTVVLTTHYMEEAYVLCDEIAIMDHGRIIAQGTPRQLLAAHFDDVILQLPAQDFEPACDGLEMPVVRHRGVIEIATPDVNGTITRLIERDVPLTHLRIRERTLEDLFLELTGTELRA